MKKRVFTLLLLAALALTPLVPAETVMRLHFVGDCTLGGHEGWMGYSIGTFKVMAEKQGNYGYFLEKCLPLFQNDDFTIANLEGVLADTPKGLNKSTKWNFRGATEYVSVLTLGSVEAVTLGNNHTGDFGKPGLHSTKDALTAAGILYSIDEESFVLEKDGVRVGFLGFSAGRYGRYKKKLPGLISALKNDQGCAAVVLQYHGGQQYSMRHNKKQTEDMRYAVDCGADLVIGHHPHVLQGIEQYKNRHIVYSLGDFCYGGNRKPRAIEYPTMVLGVDLHFDAQGAYAGQRLTIHPFHISATRPRNDYRPCPVSGKDADEVMRIIADDTPFPLAPYQEGAGAVQAYLPHEP